MENDEGKGGIFVKKKSFTRKKKEERYEVLLFTLYNIILEVFFLFKMLETLI